MDNNCSVIKDLLPLYVDGVTSPDSSAYIEAHLKTCPENTDMYNKLKNNEYVSELKEESTEVIKAHAKKEKRTSATVGAVVAAILMIPVIVCMIVNLAVGHTLSWFFIVLASMMVVASLVIVPLTAIKNKGMWTVLSFTGSLIILFAVINLMTGGHWFFVASTATIFGLAVFFMPVLAHAIKTGFFSRNKALFVIGADTILYFLMIFAIGLTVKLPGYFRYSLSISAVCLLFVWLVMFIAAYLKTNKLVKAGLITFISGLFMATINNIIGMILGYTVTWHAFRPFTRGYLNSNIYWLEFIVGATVGVILIIAGLLKKKEAK